ncbi:MAG TPA: hypothetical protein VHA79_10955 [Mycobacteriales bacterium]|nr:hypothetical protein [Mycobacteriales bacterium]
MRSDEASQDRRAFRARCLAPYSWFLALALARGEVTHRRPERRWEGEVAPDPVWGRAVPDPAPDRVGSGPLQDPVASGSAPASAAPVLVVRAAEQSRYA